MQGHAQPRAGLGQALARGLVRLRQKKPVQGHDLVSGGVAGSAGGVAQGQERGQAVAAAAHGNGEAQGFGPQSSPSQARTCLRKA